MVTVSAERPWTGVRERRARGGRVGGRGPGLCRNVTLPSHDMPLVVLAPMALPAHGALSDCGSPGRACVASSANPLQPSSTASAATRGVALAAATPAQRRNGVKKQRGGAKKQVLATTAGGRTTAGRRGGGGALARKGPHPRAPGGRRPPGTRHCVAVRRPPGAAAWAASPSRDWVGKRSVQNLPCFAGYSEVPSGQYIGVLQSQSKWQSTVSTPADWPPP